MWVSILKYAAKAAVAAGLHQKAAGWLKSKFKKAAEDKIASLENKLSAAIVDAETKL